jgi:toxin ParE1/3/4
MARGRDSQSSTITSHRIPSPALAMVERLLDRSETLEIAPRGGTRLPAFVDDEVRELLERAYRITYRISATGIEILTVKHYRRRLIDRPDAPNHPVPFIARYRGTK